MKRFAPIASVLLFVLAALPALAEGRIEKSVNLAPGGRLVVDTSAGAVAVEGGQATGATIVVTSRDDDFEKKWDVKIEETAGEVRVTARPKGGDSLLGRLFGGSMTSPSFEISVPEKTSVKIETAGGSIRGAKLEGAFDASTAGGSIQVRGVKGTVKVETAGGSIDTADLSGPLEAHTSGGSIRVSGVAGDVNVETSGGSISLDGITGRIEAETSGGSIDAEFTKGNDRGGRLETSGGGVRVRLDPSVRLTIDAETSAGSATTDLPLTVTGGMGNGRIHGSLNGGGETLKIESSAGPIRIGSIATH